jgi:hypothetical protein
MSPLSRGLHPPARIAQSGVDASRTSRCIQTQRNESALTHRSIAPSLRRELWLRPIQLEAASQIDQDFGFTRSWTIRDAEETKAPLDVGTLRCWIEMVVRFDQRAYNETAFNRPNLF